MKIKVWIVVNIDHYGGDQSECWCSFNNYAGLKVFTDYDAAVAHSAEQDKGYAQGSEIEEVEIEISDLIQK